MKALSLLLATSCLFSTTLAQPVPPPPPDKILFVYEITRHGARFGLNKDYFNETSPDWRGGELTQIGKR